MWSRCTGTVFCSLNEIQCDENLYLLKRRICTNFQLTFFISFKSQGCQTTVRSVRPVYISRFIAIFALQNNWSLYTESRPPTTKVIWSFLQAGVKLSSIPKIPFVIQTIVSETDPPSTLSSQKCWLFQVPFCQEDQINKISMLPSQVIFLTNGQLSVSSTLQIFLVVSDWNKNNPHFLFPQDRVCSIIEDFKIDQAWP